ncbi:major facilitator superfamily domain-containing protein [Fimicolochytrium jonesii]|uniref:major facilitator superfamily domain-containing protein n=1 Tax=Fimicolochytrium jonesii TaxID=1396493 RepID=UPI0022FE4B6D|nr:major facilitator superfamily domain-containing protein [Fimicolochytrium jonesii]KAI8824883.1 major facilitator superfamily domain-containing protein [Fimicolochytrium jonesii]
MGHPKQNRPLKKLTAAHQNSVDQDDGDDDDDLSGEGEQSRRDGRTRAGAVEIEMSPVSAMSPRRTSADNLTENGRIPSGRQPGSLESGERPSNLVHHHPRHRHRRAPDHAAPTPSDPTARRQAFLLLLCLVPESILEAMLVPLYPFIVRSLPGIPATQTGYYTGLLGSAFYAPLLVTNIFWGHLSDRHGRKPVLMMGIAAGGAAATMLTFGRSFEVILVGRFVAGLFGANSTVTKGMLGELFVDESGRGWAYAMYGVQYGVSGILGPFLAGLLVDPATKWPGVFASPWWKERPFALACGVGVALMCLGFLLLTTCVHEPRKARVGSYAKLDGGDEDLDIDGEEIDDFMDQDTAAAHLSKSTTLKPSGDTDPTPSPHHPSSLSSLDSDSDTEDPAFIPTVQSSTSLLISPSPRPSSTSTHHTPTNARYPLLTRQTLLPIAFYCTIAFVNMMDYAALPLFFSSGYIAPSSPSQGSPPQPPSDTPQPIIGLRLSPTTTSLYLSTIAITKLVTQLVLFRPLLAKLGKWGAFRAGGWCFCVGNAGVAVLVALFANTSATQSQQHPLHAERIPPPQQQPEPHDLLFLYILPPLLTLGLAEVAGYLSIIILITDSVSPLYLGAAHGLASTCAAGVRAVAPGVAGSVWEWGSGVVGYTGGGAHGWVGWGSVVFVGAAGVAAGVVGLVGLVK